MIQPRLIYDIGAHQGDDTAWYLQLGYQVIAVEANPALAKELENKYDGAIRDKKLRVLNVAIAAKDNETIPFFISRYHGRSSTIKHLAERDGSVAQTIEIATARLSSLFEKYGTPHYCKIDIEGNDAIAINSLAGKTGCPLYISCEHSSYTIEELHNNTNQLFETLNGLRAAGYTSFQLIDQESLLTLTGEKYYSRIHTLYSRARTKLERLTCFYSSRYSNRQWIAQKRKVRSDFVTSPFGDLLTDVWTDHETTRKFIQLHFNDYYAHTQNKQLAFWIDIHARY
jgi:FkbM family methyltransferase